jgi:hypothetical protein
MQSLKRIHEVDVAVLTPEQTAQVRGGAVAACVPDGCDCFTGDERAGYSLGCTILDAILN